MRDLLCVVATLALCSRGLAAAEPQVAGPTKVQTPPVLRANQGDRSSAKAAAAGPIRHWIFAPGRYTNDPTTGKRVDQFKKIAPVERIPNDLYYSPNGPHPYGPDYNHNQIYRLPGIAPFPHALPGLGLPPALPLGPRLPW